ARASAAGQPLEATRRAPNSALVERPGASNVLTRRRSPTQQSLTCDGVGILSPPQSPAPGFGDNKLALSGFPSQSFASGGGSCFLVIFGQTRAYSALMVRHFSIKGSVSGLIASTGHSGSQTPQSMHSSGWITSMFSPS